MITKVTAVFKYSLVLIADSFMGKVFSGNVRSTAFI